MRIILRDDSNINFTLCQQSKNHNAPDLAPPKKIEYIQSVEYIPSNCTLPPKRLLNYTSLYSAISSLFFARPGKKHLKIYNSYSLLDTTGN